MGLLSGGVVLFAKLHRHQSQRSSTLGKMVAWLSFDLPLHIACSNDPSLAFVCLLGDLDYGVLAGRAFHQPPTGLLFWSGVRDIVEITRIAWR